VALGEEVAACLREELVKATAHREMAPLE